MDGRREDGPVRSGGVAFGGAVGRAGTATPDTDLEASATFALTRLERRSRRTFLPAVAVAASMIGVVSLALIGRPTATLDTADGRAASDARIAPSAAHADPGPAAGGTLLVVTAPSHEGAYAGSDVLHVVGYVRGGERFVNVAVGDRFDRIAEATLRASAKAGDPAATSRSWFDQGFPLAGLPAGDALWVEVRLLGDDGTPLELVRRGVSREIAAIEVSPILGGRSASGEQGSDGLMGGIVFGGPTAAGPRIGTSTTD